MTVELATVSTSSVHRSTIVAEALHHRLGDTPGIRSCGWATRASEVLDGVTVTPDVWVVDLDLPNSGALVLCDRLHRELRTSRMVLLASLDGASDVARVLPLVERGASGVVDARASWPLLVRAVRAVADGQNWLSRALESDLLNSVLLSRATDDLVIRDLLRLTEREREVLLVLCRGGSRDDVAETLNISVHTARTHIQRVLAKLGVHSQREVVALGVQHRLVEWLAAP